MNRIALLNEDVLLHLSRNYLSERDRLAFALSGTSERFPLLYASNRKQLVMRECYFISASSWEPFFLQYINPSLITAFDASSCYWLPASVLCNSIKQMDNLVDLQVHDTKMSLTNLPELFEACQKIVKFSLTLSEKNMDRFERGVKERKSLEWIKQGFRRITHLQIFSCVALNDDKFYHLQPWLGAFGLLKWCRNCVDLVIQVTATEINCRSNNLEDEEKIDTALKKLKPLLEWMKKLKSLAIIRKDSSDSYYHHHFYIIKWLLFFLKGIQKESRSLERLIINKDDIQTYNFRVFLDWFMAGTSVKSFALLESYFWERNPLNILNHERFRHLEQLANITFSHRLENLTELKYVHGRCGNDIQGLNDFLEAHSKLEELRFHGPIGDERNRFFGAEGWKLLSLKDLVYHCGKVDQRILDQFKKASPNLKQLEIEFSSSPDKRSSISFFASIQFQNLKRLCLRGDNLFDGSYLISIFQQCPKLERLHLEVENCDGKALFVNLAKCLPSSTNLLDLRMKWKFLQISPAELLLVMNALKDCPKLERFGLLVENGESRHPSDYYASFENSLVKLVKEMPHLVALCLAGLDIDLNGAVQRQLIDEVIPERPAFWAHLSVDLPTSNDLSVPKIHYEEIVNPIHAWYSPPRF